MSTHRITQIPIIFLLSITSDIHAGEYTIVDTGQDRCYNNSRQIPCPASGGQFDGQDSQYKGNHPQYRDNGNGTITDLNTGLMWQKTPSKRKIPYRDARNNASSFALAGYEDWRLPTVKELYSLIDFRGHIGRSEAQSIPFINTKYFHFYYGDTSRGERLIDAQYWTSTEYTGLTMHGNRTTFGINFADGRIKGYPSNDLGRGHRNKRFVRYVRGNPEYGTNNFKDNGDGTITDHATGLIWMKTDSKKTMNWQEALTYAETSTYAGYSDWRLPNAKELQSIIDYTKSPQALSPANRTIAIDSLFVTSDKDGWYWSSTTHLEHRRASAAVYLCFGQAWGYLGKGKFRQKVDVHGAGAQRSDPKSGNPSRYSDGRGPQGDEVRIYNLVRLVRGGNVIRSQSNPPLINDRYPHSLSRGYSHPEIQITTDRIRGVEMGGIENSKRLTNQSFSSQDQAPQARSHTQPPNNIRHSLTGESMFIYRLDRDNDGKVSRSEFDGPPHHFDYLDKDGDGFINAGEAQNVPPPRRR